MVSTGINYNKLKTNLRLAINRLKMLEKKKTELAQKARKEIGEYIATGKYDRAKIRVEHIIREDYVVEAMELVEMYCDLLLARFGLIQQMKTLDEGLAEAISSLIWVAPRLQTDVQELKVISDLLTYKYGKQYAQACRENALRSVNEKLMIKMGVQAPPKILVEKYLIEIAKSLNIPYEPDLEVMRDEEPCCGEDVCGQSEKYLIDLGNEASNQNQNPGGPSIGGGGSGLGFLPPSLPSQPPSAPYPNQPMKPLGFSVPPHTAPYQYPPPNAQPHPSASFPMSGGHPPPPNYETVIGADGTSKTVNIPPAKQKPDNNKPAPAPRTTKNDSFPELPAVPTGSLPEVPTNSDEQPKDDSIDFDDLTKRFEELKKRK